MNPVRERVNTLLKHTELEDDLLKPEVEFPSFRELLFEGVLPQLRLTYSPALRADITELFMTVVGMETDWATLELLYKRARQFGLKEAAEKAFKTIWEKLSDQTLPDELIAWFCNSLPNSKFAPTVKLTFRTPERREITFTLAYSDENLAKVGPLSSTLFGLEINKDTLPTTVIPTIGAIRSLRHLTLCDPQMDDNTLYTFWHWFSTQSPLEKLEFKDHNATNPHLKGFMRGDHAQFKLDLAPLGLKASSLEEAKRKLLEYALHHPEQKEAIRSFYLKYQRAEDMAVLVGEIPITVNAYLTMLASQPLKRAFLDFKEAQGQKVFPLRSLDEATYAPAAFMTTLREFITMGLKSPSRSESVMEVLVWSSRFEFQELYDATLFQLYRELPSNFEGNPELIMEIYENAQMLSDRQLAWFCLSFFHLAPISENPTYVAMTEVIDSWVFTQPIYFSPPYRIACSSRLRSDFSLQFPLNPALNYAALLPRLFEVYQNGKITLIEPESDTLEAVFQALTYNRSITSLTIREGVWSDQALNCARVMLEHNTTLKYLELEDVGAPLFLLFPGLAKNKGLESLRLKNTVLGSLEATTLADALTTNTTLETLYLYACHLEDQGFIALARGLSKNQKLKELSIEQDSLTDAAIGVLAELAKHNKTLTSVVLAENHLEDLTDLPSLINNWHTANEGEYYLGLERNPQIHRYLRSGDETILIKPKTRHHLGHFIIWA